MVNPYPDEEYNDADDLYPDSPDARAHARNPHGPRAYPMPDGSTVDGEDVHVQRQGLGARNPY
jgi:hypothetical protein